MGRFDDPEPMSIGELSDEVRSLRSTLRKRDVEIERAHTLLNSRAPRVERIQVDGLTVDRTIDDRVAWYVKRTDEEVGSLMRSERELDAIRTYLEHLTISDWTYSDGATAIENIESCLKSHLHYANAGAQIRIKDAITALWRCLLPSEAKGFNPGACMADTNDAEWMEQ